MVRQVPSHSLLFSLLYHRWCGGFDTKPSQQRGSICGLVPTQGLPTSMLSNIGTSRPRLPRIVRRQPYELTSLTDLTVEPGVKPRGNAGRQLRPRGVRTHTYLLC